MSIKLNIEEIESNIREFEKKYNRLSESAKLIPVSKVHPIEKIIEAMNEGYTIFGESYVQELTKKYEDFEAKGINQPIWHFIGHLQSNKVKYIAPFIDTIHTVDSLKLAKEIDKRAEQNNRIIKILIQVNTSGEESKFGIKASELNDLIAEIKDYNNIKIIGLMTIAGLEATAEENEVEFQLLSKLLNEVNEKFNINLTELSMGMTSDYELAIKQGSTMIRIGTAIFGEREYE